MKADHVTSTVLAEPVSLGSRGRKASEGDPVRVPAVVVEPVSLAARQAGAGALIEKAATGRIVRVVV